MKNLNDTMKEKVDYIPYFQYDLFDIFFKNSSFFNDILFTDFCLHTSMP